MKVASLLCVAGLVACGEHKNNSDDDASGDGGVACIANLTAIAVSPADQHVALAGGTAAPVIFVATGTFADGSSRDLDVTKLAWSVAREDDTPPGTIEAGVMSPNPNAGGVVRVAATDSCQTGTTTVIFDLDTTVGQPTDPNDWTPPPTTAGAVPSIVYPSNETKFPRNIYRTLFQWRSQGYGEHRLTFAGPHSTVTVYTDGAHSLCADANPVAGCFEADEQTWSFIAGSNAGESVTWTVDSLDRSTTPPTVRRGAPISISFSRRDVKGAIFYWSTTSAGVRRANVADEFPEDYITGKPVATTYANPTDKVQCVACHTVSRDGQYMLAPVSASSGGSLWIMGVTANAPPDPLVKTVEDTRGHGFATISPDNVSVVAAWGGKMWMVDRATGTYQADLPLGTTQATHPDWSPDGTKLVFATSKGDAPGDSALAIMSYNGGTSWSAPTTLVARPANQGNAFPAFSPDGQFVAFARGKGGHGDVTAQLMLVPTAGGAPVELIRANRVVSNTTTSGQHQNSQPTWAPEGDVNWVAFNSKRAYGVVRGPGTQQIWVAAVDLASGAIDPSYPAFRLQFQGLDENNHRAYWTQDIRTDPPPPPPPTTDGGVCVATGQQCTPGDTCCDSQAVCDTQDNGDTYSCFVPVILKRH